MPIVQNILSRICCLLEEDSSCQEPSPLKESNTTDRSLFEQLAIVSAPLDEIGLALARLLRPECAQSIDEHRVRQELARLDDQGCRRLF